MLLKVGARFEKMGGEAVAESRQLAPGTINLRFGAVRRLLTKRQIAGC